MAIAFGLLAALSYGIADFAGGLVSKRNEVLRVVLISQIFGTVPLVISFPLLNDGVMSSGALAWGVGAGVAGATGVVLLYRGLARGRMSVVAPITAVEAAIVPVLFGLAIGERPSGIAVTGIAIALAAVTLITATPVTSTPGGAETAIPIEPVGSGVPEALGAGLAFGVFFILLDGAGDASGMWPLLAMRAGSLAIVALAAAATRVTMHPAPGTLAGIAIAGLLDVAANVFYLLSTRHGLLSIVAVITSMYPAATVLLARLVLNERLARSQLAGLACAAIGIAFIAVG